MRNIYTDVGKKKKVKSCHFNNIDGPKGTVLN